MLPFPLRHASRLIVASLTLLLGSAAAGTFKNPELIETSYDPSGIATTDFNHDGILDLVYVDGSGTATVHVLLGKGNGTFSHTQDIDLPAGTCGFRNCSINFADVTQDGNVDILLGGGVTTTGQIVVLPGSGDGTFQSAIVSTMVHPGSNGGSPFFNSQFGIGDVNGDGTTDLVVADAASATLYVLLGDGTGKFSVGTTMTYYFTGGTSAYLFDLNGDGQLDIVVNDLVGAQTYVLLGKGNGTFKPAVVYRSFALLLTDLDGDGHPDLVGSSSPGQIEVLKGNPDGTFGSPTAVTTVPAGDQLVASADFNGDGIADLALVTPSGVGIVLGKGNLTYSSITSSVAGTVVTGFYHTGVAGGDFNGDGRYDLAMAVNGGVLILLGNSDGTFVSGDSYDVGKTVGTVSVADFSGDKLPDIAVTVSAIYPRLLLGNGAGTFTLGTDQNQSYGSQSPSASMTPADFNGDGKSDLSILEPTDAYPFGQSFVLLGAANGTFAMPAAIPTGPAQIGDANDDGRSDIITASGDSILALLGQANGTFAQMTTPVIHPTSGVTAVGDLNHDGKLDLLVFEYPSSLRVWLGNGAGSFTQSNLVSTPSERLYAQSVTIADLDGDGNGDIIVVPYPDPTTLTLPLVIYYGNGNGTFQDGVLLPISHAYTQLVVTDVNRDNRLDLVLSDGAGIAVIANLGGRAFAPEEHFVAGLNISGLTVVDVNGDGFPDIIAANAGGTTVSVLLNQPNGQPIDGEPSNGVFTVSPEPALYAQSVTLSITMSSPSGPVPTGSVSFSLDGSFIATTSLANGKAVYAYGGVLTTGTHAFVATYDGNQTYAPERFSALHVVLPPVYPTQTVLVAAPRVAYTSQTVRLTATVHSAVKVPAGTVTFLDGTNTLGAQTFYYQSSVLVLDTNLLAAGTHSLTAVYQGYQDSVNEQGIYQPSTSAPITVTVKATTTTTGLSASTTSPTAGTVVTFTANVASVSAAPFGGVTFYDGAVPLGTGSLLADGSCSYSTASLSAGTHSVTAVYNANATFASSTSAVITVKVTSAAVRLPSTIVAMTVTGDMSVLVAKVSALNGLPAGVVTFLDGGNILGRVPTDGSGTASWTVPRLNGGVHNLFASFAGTPQFAPSVSPGLLEQFPEGEAGFSLAVAADPVDGLFTDSRPVPVMVVATAGFQRQVQLSCADGVPTGYECFFSPSRLYGGNSYLRIQASSKSLMKRTNPIVSYGAAVGLFSFLLIGAVSRRRFICLVLCMACLSLTIMTGCGTPTAPAGQSQLMVFSIRATAGTGGSTIVHSAQILVNIRSAE